MSKFRKACGVLSLGLFYMLSCLVPEGRAATEEILSFHSDITVQEDASLTVRETITVVAAGDKIKRGIYRDFPARYKDLKGNNYVVGFSVEGVSRNGNEEPYFTQPLSNGQRVYIGDKNVYLPFGTYTYVLTYTTSRQLGFFKDFDELYWNVTGNGWEFDMADVSATVRLPRAAAYHAKEIDGYTGYQGDKGKDFISERRNDTVYFKVTRPLRAREGLTIVVNWPKGYVHEPTRQEKLEFFIQDNRGTFLGGIGLILVLLYYFVMWARVGRDPRKGTIIPQFAPPENFSPGLARYVLNMGFDDKILTATIVNMAVKGFLKINQTPSEYSLVKTGATEEILTPEEQNIARELFGNASSLIVKSANYRSFQDARDSLKDSLRKTGEKIYFILNNEYFIPGLLGSLLILAASILMDAQRYNLPEAIFAFVWTAVWSFGVFTLCSQVFMAWRTFFVGGQSSLLVLGGAIFMTIFALPFVAGELVGLTLLAKATSVAVMLVAVLVLLVNFVFSGLMKAPTLKGRKLMDHLEGFKMYLSVAEKERLNALNPPEQTVALFEKFLPYALALGVEQKWAEKFSGVLAKAAQEGYAPRWYSGTAWHPSRLNAFSSSLGSAFSQAIASSSVAPGSRSGGGGGGSSGGGGGGGGGGGW